MIDLEPEAIDNMKSSKHGHLFNSEYLLAGKEDASNNFARGHYTVGRELIDKVNDRLRKIFNNCDNCQGFIMNHSVGGGTGSGLGSLILDRIHYDYRKKDKIDLTVYPFNNNFSNNTVEAYNALLCTHRLRNYVNVSFTFDNRQIYNICKNTLYIQKPSYYSMNSIISKISSGLTSSMRFESDLNVDLKEFETNLVGMPRVNFIVSGTAPLIVADENK